MKDQRYLGEKITFKVDNYAFAMVSFRRFLYVPRVIGASSRTQGLLPYDSTPDHVLPHLWRRPTRSELLV
jgi:hypothetical protein